MRYLLILLLLAGGVSRACAQTTQPAPVAWEQTVQTVAKSLAAGDDCAAQTTADCFIRSFDSASTRHLADVAAHTSGATLLMAKAYLFPDGAIAGDIGAAVSGSQVSDDVKKLLVPPDADGIAKANVTAVRWVQSALSAASADPVAVLVFYTGDPSQAASPDGQVLFVMLKGHKDSAGTYLVNQIVYGDSQQASMTSAR
jgi:hypothetical protein